MTDTNEGAAPQADLDVLLAAAQASEKESAETEVDEGGPDESGELPEADAPFAADEDDDPYDPDEDGEPDDDQDDDDELEEPDDEDPEDDEDDEEPDPQEKRLLALEERLEASLSKTAELEQQNQELARFLREGAVPKQQPQQQRDPEFTKAWRAANVGGAEAIQDFDPKIQREVVELARMHAEAKADWALDPEAEYRTRFEFLVERAIERRIAPYEKERQQNEIDSVLAPHQEFLKEHRKLVLEHLPETYAKDPDDPRVLRQRLEIAVSLAKAKLAEGGLRKREQKVTTRSRQQEAKRRSRQQSSRKPRKGQVEAPRIKGVDGDSIFDLAQTLANDPAALKQAERNLRR